MKNRMFWLVGCAICLLAAASVVAQEADKEDKSAPVKEAVKAAGQEKAAAKAPAKAGTPVALTMEAIQEMEDRQKALDMRERQLTERAKALDVQEKILKEKLRRMEELNQKMAERLDGFKKEHEAKVAKLVSVVETMKPQSAAEYVENLDPELAVEILARIQVAKAAKILNLVDKKKSARLTELYTGYRTQVNEPGPAPASVKEVAPASKPM